MIERDVHFGCWVKINIIDGVDVHGPKLKVRNRIIVRPLSSENENAMLGEIVYFFVRDPKFKKANFKEGDKIYYKKDAGISVMKSLYRVGNLDPKIEGMYAPILLYHYYINPDEIKTEQLVAITEKDILPIWRI